MKDWPVLGGDCCCNSNNVVKKWYCGMPLDIIATMATANSVIWECSVLKRSCCSITNIIQDIWENIPQTRNSGSNNVHAFGCIKSGGRLDWHSNNTNERGINQWQSFYQGSLMILSRWCQILLPAIEFWCMFLLLKEPS